MEDPFSLLRSWLEEERKLGVPNPQQAVLSTVAAKQFPHSRVVAIREISGDGLLFFTQKGTRKVTELLENPHATLNFWLELLQREVIVEGSARPLSNDETNSYWQSYPRETQIRFYSYAPTSTQPIESKQSLEEKKKQVEREYANLPLPLSPFYCGFRIVPRKFVFYAYRTDELSDVCSFQLGNATWIKSLLSP